MTEKHLERADDLASEILARRAGCPDSDRLQDFDGGALGPHEMREVEAHAGACGACGAALRFLRGERGEGPGEIPAEVAGASERLIASLVAPGVREEIAARPGAGRSSAKRRFLGPWLIPALAAGVAVVALLAAGGFQRLGRGAWSGPADDLGELRGAAPLDPIAPAGRVPSAPSRFEWTPQPGAAAYRVTLLDENVEEIWTRTTKDDTPRLEIGAEEARPMIAGARFTWQVAALGELRQEIGRSPAVHFEIGAASP